MTHDIQGQLIPVHPILIHVPHPQREQEQGSCGQKKMIVSTKATENKNNEHTRFWEVEG